MHARLICLVLLCVAPGVCIAQAPADTTTSLMNVYLDCETSGCDFDFFRTELTAVNWVRDRQVADVHILVTTQRTGAGGREYTVTFFGQRQFAGVTDTLKYVAGPSATQDDIRRGLVRTFRLGLVRYLARTAAAERITVTVTQPKTGVGQTTAKTDPWNYWVFNTSVRGFTFGEETFKDYNVFGSISANRVTEQWKTSISVNESYSQNEFETSDTTTFVNIRRGYGGSVLQVKSMGQHWSAGFRGSLSSSTYDNFRRAIRLFPALEYNVFPYSQSTRRQLRLEYNIVVADFAYHDTTIFDKMKERMPLQQLSATVASREKWGSIDVGMRGVGYLHDRSKYRVGSFAELSLRLFRGLNFDAFVNYDVIRDQFALAKKEFTQEQILTRQFQRGTRYRYYGNVGFRYTFGSIYSNIVNPRMASDFF